jgi:hypothetical protein
MLAAFPQGLKPRSLLDIHSTAEELAEKRARSKGEATGAKARSFFQCVYGMTEIMPCYETYPDVDRIEFFSKL